jgi:hypothetical protein
MALACATAVCWAWSSALGGCSLFGAITENARRVSFVQVPAKIDALAGKSFAVLVAADRATQAEHPGLVERITTQVTERLANPANKPKAGGFIPAQQVLAFQYRNPSWGAKSIADLAGELGGVQRLVFIELTEYRLHEAGNPYEWGGSGVASITVYDTQSAGETPMLTETVSVRFPDIAGVGPDQLSRAGVTTVLSSRLIDRVSWLFYEHEEPYEPEY